MINPAVSRSELRQALGLSTTLSDSVIASGNISGDTAVVTENPKSPLIAVLLSAVVPGAGQVYNGSYWKVPIILGAQGFFVSQWISNNKLYRDYRSEYSLSITPANPSGDPNLLVKRDGYRDQRDSYAWYIAGVYILSMLDAYVDAELSGFDVSPGLAAGTESGPTVTLSFRHNF